MSGDMTSSGVDGGGVCGTAYPDEPRLSMDQSQPTGRGAMTCSGAEPATRMLQAHS